MANTKSTQHEIPLTGSLNLNKFKADIKPYEGFNERNAPFYGGCLSPLYIKDGGTAGNTSQYYDGHEYSTSGGSLKKDGSTIMTVSTTGFKKDVYNKGEEYLNYYDSDHYIKYENGQVEIQYGTSVFTNPNDGTYVNSKIESNDDIILMVVATATKLRVCGQINGTVKSIAVDISSDNIDPHIDSTRISTKKIYGPNGKKFWAIMYKGGIWTFGDYFDGPNNAWKSGLCSAWMTDGQTYQDIFSAGATYKVYSQPSRIIVDYKDGSNRIHLGELRNFYNTSDSYRVPAAVPTLYRLVASKNKSFVWAGWKMTQGTSSLDPFNITCYLGKCSGDLGSSDKYTTYAYTQGWIINVGEPTLTSVDTTTTSASNYNSMTGYGKGIGTNQSGSPFFRYKYTPLGNQHKMYIDMNDVAGFRSNNGLSWYSINGEWPSLPGGTIKRYGNWRLLLDKDCIPIGFSYGYNQDIGTLVTPWGSIDSSKQIHGDEDEGFTFYDVDEQSWTRIHLQAYSNTPFEIIGDYIVLNTADYYNCYRISDGTRHHWASDWNNRINVSDAVSTMITSVPSSSTSYTLASGQNPTWSDDDPPSATFGAVIVNVGNTLSGTIAMCGNDPSGINLIKIFKDSSYWTTIMSVNSSGVATLATESGYSAFWPTQVRYNIPILFDVVDSGFDLTLVKFGETSFAVMYYDNKIRYQYTNNSIASFDNMFVLQAQAYGLARDRIYALTYSGDTLMSSQVVAPTLGLRFIGATLYNAYFYSATTRAIYSFGADNNLKVFTQADSITSVTGASYLPATGSILIGTPDCLYVLNEMFGIYRINDIKNFSVASQGNGVVNVKTTDNHKYVISYESKYGFTKYPVILDTSFYGAGSNVVSVNDCWYLRVTDPNHSEGEIKMAVSTLTDIGRQTEERTFKIKAKDWDELTDSFYLRFQPKLQRAVGVSLHLESPFKVGYLGVGATPETLQLNNKGSI